MPIPVFGEIYYNGIQSVPYASVILKVLPWLVGLYLIKFYFNGTRNGNERVMHGKVVMVTGGTSGIGAAVVHDLAARGAQLILLVKDPSDIFMVDYIEDLRTRYNNDLIYAEACDLSSLHSIRLFATKFIDNSPPRRLDMVICCAGLMAPPFSTRASTLDGVEAHWGLNYLANFQLLNILTPVLRAQPPDRDVRVLLATCTSYVLGDLDLNDVQFVNRGYPSKAPWRCYGASKLALMSFGVEFQRRCNAYQRPDKMPNNVRCYSIDPGVARSPGTRRWLTFGSLWGLGVYLFTWPFWWIVLKDTEMAAQTFLAAAMSPECGQGEGGKFLRECQNQKYRKEDITSEEVGSQLWEITALMIKDVEKASAIKRALEQKESGNKQTPKGTKEEEIDKELKEKIRKQATQAAAKQKARREALEKILEEEEAKDAKARGKLPVQEEVVDSPSRNTRSKTPSGSKALGKVVKAEEPPSGDTAAKNTRRRTKKA